MLAFKIRFEKKKKTKKTINFFAGKFQRFSGFCFFTHTIQQLFHFCNFLFEANALTTNEACRFHRKLERYVTRGHYWASREIRRKILWTIRTSKLNMIAKSVKRGNKRWKGARDADKCITGVVFQFIWCFWPVISI